jgi:hypothetical protein
MVTVRNACKNRTRLSALAYAGEEKLPQSWKMIGWQASSANHQLLTMGCDWKRILFLTGRRGNVVENKGPLWKTWGRSWNVYENTGT